ncbi:MAG: tetratricopeptide repeat protein [Candidatus Poribacteria bacterium]
MEEHIEHIHDHNHNHEHKETIKLLYRLLFTIVFVPLCLIVIRPYIVRQIDIRGQSYIGFDNYEEAIRQYKKTNLLDKKNVIHKNWLAYSYHMSNDNENAIKTYSQVIEIDPNNKEALLNLGLILALDGKIHNAIPYFERLKQLGDKNILQTLFVCYERTGELDKAENLLVEMLSMNPENKNIQNKLNGIRKKMNKK